MKIKTTLLVLCALTSGIGEASEPQITAVAFQRCTSKAHCSEITRWSETQHASPSRDVRVVATIVDQAGYSNDFYLLTTTEYVIAPLSAYSVADLEKLKTGTEVSWGQLTTDDDMRALVLHGVHRERAVRLRTLDLQKVLRTSFSEPDALWPWLVRVTAILVNRQGQIISTRFGILELAASTARMKTSSQQPAQR